MKRFSPRQPDLALEHCVNQDLILLDGIRNGLFCPAQDQANQYSSMEKGGDFQVPHLAEVLLVVGGCWGPESEFSSVVWPMCPYPS